MGFLDTSARIRRTVMAELPTLPDNFVKTLAQGIADFTLGQTFCSAETGVVRRYERIAAEPGYQDMGDDAAPPSRPVVTKLSKAASRELAREVAPEDFNNGVLTGVDDTLLIQAAADYAEANGMTLRFTAGLSYIILGTVYLGTLRIRAMGALLVVQLSDAFVQRGTASMRNEGAILTKSSFGAGYGVATVALDIDELTIFATRSSKTSPVKASLLLQNVSSLTGARITSTIVTAGAARDASGLTETVPLDFRDGVQNVSVPLIRVLLDNPGGLGGFWIRSRTEGRDTCFVEIGSILAVTNTRDEPVAIFNSGTAATDVHDVHIGYIGFRNDGGGGLGPSVTRIVGDYDPTKMQRISIDRIEGVIGAIGPQVPTASGGFGVKVQKCYATIGSVKLTYNGKWDASQPTIFGVRFASTFDQKDPLFISSIEINVEYPNAVPSGSGVAMVYGPISTNSLRVRGAGSGFRHVARFTADLRGVDVQSPAYSEYAVYGGASLQGLVDGPTRDVGPQRGTIMIDTARWGGAIIYRPTNVGSYSTLQLDVDIKLSGAGALTRIAAIETSTAASLLADVRYRLDNAGFASIGADTITGNASLTRYDAIKMTTAGVYRVAWPTLALLNHTITVFTDHHTIDTEGAVASDTLTSITPGKDRQTVILKTISSSKRVTVLTTGNIQTAGEFTFVDRRDHLALQYDADTSSWNEIARSSVNPLTVLSSGSVLTIDANGAIAAARSLHRISATGTIKTITGGYSEGQLLRLFPAAGTTLTIQHANGGNISCSTGANIVAANPGWIDLWWSRVSNVWFAKP